MFFLSKESRELIIHDRVVDRANSLHIVCYGHAAENERTCKHSKEVYIKKTTEFEVQSTNSGDDGHGDDDRGGDGDVQCRN